MRILRVVPTSVDVSLFQEGTTSMSPSLLTTLTSDAKGAALVGIRAVLTEENTDFLVKRLASLVSSKLPWYAKWLPIGVMLDHLLPDTLLKVFEEFLAP